MNNGNAYPITLRIGVTGHRDLPDAASAREQIIRVLMAIQCAAQKQNHSTVKLQVVSALADGADQIVARHGLELGYELVAVSPSRIDDYKKKMTDPAAFQALWNEATPPTFELRGDLYENATPEARHAAYEQCGEWILDNCDFLIAVFDINHPHKDGGTASIVRKSLQWDCPAILVEPLAGKSPYLIGNLSLDEFDAILSSNNHPKSIPSDGLTDIKELDHLVANFIEGENDPCRRDLHREIAWQKSRPLLWRIAENTRQFWRQPWQGLWSSQPKDSKDKSDDPAPRHGPLVRMLSHWYEDFAHLFAWIRHYPDYLRDRRKRRATATMQVQTDSPSPKSKSANIKDDYDAARKMPKELAGLYKDLYLSTYIIMVVLGLTSVFCALLHLHLGSITRFWVWMELALIILIICIYSAGHFFRWQHRMVDYRLLAEWLRNGLPLALLGVKPPRFAIPLPYAQHDPARTWVRTHFLQCVSEIRSERPTPDWSNTADREEVQRYILDEWIGVQISYHMSNRNRAASLHGVLNALCLFFAIAAVICCCLELRYEWELGILAAMLPAILGACHGIASQAELRRLMDRSAAMVFHLRRADVKVRRLFDSNASQEAIGKWAQETAKLLFEEVNEWRAVFVMRPAELPI